MIKRKDIQTPDDIAVLVYAFYDAVRADADLAPIFELRITDDAWSAHLHRMCQFWGLLLLQDHAFQGNPFKAHIGLPVEGKHFDRWLLLWVTTVHDHFEGPTATLAIEKARNIASVFRSKLVDTPIPLLT